MQNSNLAGTTVLIVEDDPLLRKQLSAHLERLGMDVTQANSAQSAKEILSKLDFDFVLLDVNLPDGNGTDLLKGKVVPPGAAVVVMTGNASIQGAVEAIKLGALDYIVKPFDPAELPIRLGRAKKDLQKNRAEEHLRKERWTDEFYFGKSLAPIQAIIQKIIEVDNRLQTFLPPVLITGETGTGKTTVARMIHRLGPRASKPLIEVNCSALPETLAESELFGHERGAFTDARTSRMGLFEAADGGTLFLDELPSLSPAIQAKVLTAIEDHTIRRVGGNRTITVDARVIAATNQDLKSAVASGKFREDLYHRLDLFRIYLPPLRERGEEIIELANILIERICKRHKLPTRKITDTGKKRLLSYHWPGNVRELAHELERAIVFEDKSELSFEHLPTAQKELEHSTQTDDWLNPDFRFPSQGFSLESAINRLIQYALKQSDGNVSAAARLLGVSRDYIRYRLSQKKDQNDSEFPGASRDPE